MGGCKPRGSYEARYSHGMWQGVSAEELNLILAREPSVLSLYRTLFPHVAALRWARFVKMRVSCHGRDPATINWW